MKKDRQVSLRVSGVVIDFIKGRLGLETDYEAVDKVLGFYYELYNPLENPFKVVDVPKNEITKQKKDEKIKIQSDQGKSKDKADILVSGYKEDGGELDAGIVTKMDKGRPVKGMYDANGLFKRL